jgi:hypothetical protein
MLRESRRHCADCRQLGKESRGMRLTDLDRSKVYRIAYVGERRRWEVLGPEPAFGASAPADRPKPGRADLPAQGACAAQADRTDGADGGRHAAPDTGPDQSVSVGGSS